MKGGTRGDGGAVYCAYHAKKFSHRNYEKHP